MDKEEINKIIGEPTGWVPPAKKLLPDTVEEFDEMCAAEDKMISDLNNTDITVVEMGKCRGSMYPTCSICDADAHWGLMSNRVAKAFDFSVSDDGEKADGKPCKTFRTCKKHLHEVVELCRNEEKQ